MCCVFDFFWKGIQLVSVLCCDLTIVFARHRELLPSACRLKISSAWRIVWAIAEVTTSSSFIIGFLESWFASPSVLSVCLEHSLCVQSFHLFNDFLELSSSETSFVRRPFSSRHRLLCSKFTSPKTTYCVHLQNIYVSSDSSLHIHRYASMSRTYV